MVIAVNSTRLAASGQNTNNATWYAIGSTPAHGSAIIVSLGSPTITDLIDNVTDTRGNVYTRVLDTGVHNPPGLRGWVYVCFSQRDLIAGDSIIVTSMLGTVLCVAIDEVSGLGSDSANTPDATATSFSGSDVGTFSTGTSGATAFANELVWAILVVSKNGGTQSITPGTGYTQQGSRITSFSVGMYTEYKIVSATGTQEADGTINTQNDKYAVGLVTLPDPQSPGNTYRDASFARAEIAGQTINRGASMVVAEVAAVMGASRAAGFIGVEVACTVGAPPPPTTPRRPSIIVT